MYCINCGAKLTSGANFCPDCGYKVVKPIDFFNSAPPDGVSSASAAVSPSSAEASGQNQDYLSKYFTSAPAVPQQPASGYGQGGSFGNSYGDVYNNAYNEGAYGGTRRYSVVSLVLGIISLVCIPLGFYIVVPWIVGIIVGIIAVVIGRKHQKLSYKFSMAGFVTGLIGLILCALIFFVVIMVACLAIVTWSAI